MIIISQMSMLMSLQQATLDSDNSASSVRRRKGAETGRKFDCQKSPGTESESDN